MMKGATSDDAGHRNDGAADGSDVVSLWQTRLRLNKEETRFSDEAQSLIVLS